MWCRRWPSQGSWPRPAARGCRRDAPARDGGGRRLGHAPRGSCQSPSSTALCPENGPPSASKQLWIANGVASAHNTFGYQGLYISIRCIDLPCRRFSSTKFICRRRPYIVYENLALQKMDAESLGLKLNPREFPRCPPLNQSVRSQPHRDGPK